MLDVLRIRHRVPYTESVISRWCSNKHVPQNLELKRRSQTAVSIGLDICTAAGPLEADTSKAHVFGRNLRRILEKLSERHSVNAVSTEQTRKIASEAVSIKKELDDAVLGLKKNNVYHPANEICEDMIYNLSKKKQPVPPAGVLLNYYETRLRVLREFARARNIPGGRKKSLLFKSIVDAFQLPKNTVFIAHEDTRKSSVQLSEAYMRATVGESTTAEIRCLPIRFPSTLIADEKFPISQFIYVNTKDVARSVLHLIRNKSSQWELEMSCEQEVKCQANSKSADLSNPSKTNDMSGSHFKQWSRLHPKLLPALKIPGLDIPTETNPYGVSNTIGVDVETTGLDPHICDLRLLTISFPKYPALIFDVFHLWKLEEKSTEAIHLLEEIKNLLINPRVTKIFFNGKFDYNFISLKLGISITQPIVDIMLMTALLEAGLHLSKRRYNLNSVTEHYLKMKLPIEKSIPWCLSEGWEHQILTTDQLVYAARDAAVLPYLNDIISPLLNEAELNYVANLENECLIPVAEIEREGIYFDRARWTTLAAENKKKVNEAELKLRKALKWDKDSSKNVNSPPQVLQALRDLNVKVMMPLLESDLKKGYIPQLPEKTNMKTLSAVIGNPEAVEALIDFRKARKLQCGFIEAIGQYINPKTGRIHCHLRQLGAISGRFTCSDPNLQQVPRDPAYRTCFCATPGNKFVIADFSQIELRVAADLAEDKTMIEAFSSDLDLHSLTASLVKDVDIDKVTKSDRQLAKALNFGLIYGISAKGLRDYANMGYGVTLSIEEAKSFREKFFQSYDGINTWQQTIQNNLILKTSINTRTRANRRVLFEDNFFTPSFQKLLNYPVQGTSADIIKQSLVDIYPHLKSLKGKIVHCIHDEIIIEVPEEAGEETLQLLIISMESAGNRYLKQVRCRVNGKLGNSWAEKP